MNRKILSGIGVISLLILVCAAYFMRPARVSAAAQQTSQGFTIEQVLSAPFTSDLVAAPRGQRIAWAFDWQGKRNVWMAEGPAWKPKQLTQYNQDDGQELTQLVFTHDGAYVVYMRGGDANNGGDFPNPTSNPDPLAQAIYAVNIETGRVRQLAEGADPRVSPTDQQVLFLKDDQVHVVSLAEGSEPHPLFYARGGTDSPQWSPDGKQVAFVSRRNPHNLIGVYDTNNQKIRWVNPSIDRDSFPRWAPDGKRLAYVRQPTRGSRPRPQFEDTPDPWTIQVADLTSGQTTEVYKSGLAMNGSLPRPAGENLLQWGRGASNDDHIVFISEEDNWMRLYSVPAKGGAVVPLSAARAEVEHIAFTPDRREIIYSSNRAENKEDVDRRHLWRVSVTGGKSTQITGNTAIQYAPAVTGDGAKLAYIFASEMAPGMPTVRDLPRAAEQDGVKAGETALVSLPAGYPMTQLTPPQQVTFRAADGQEVHGQLFMPLNARPGEKLPAVVFAHGGPMRQMLLGWHYMYYYHNAYGFNQWLASKGYAVLSINFRSGIGYGREFRVAPRRGGMGASEYQDIVAGAQFLRARNDIDAARIGMWGGSYGGYLTALALGRNSDLFACGVDLHGVHDWSARVSNTLWVGSDDRDLKKIAFEASPISAVDKWKSPVLFIHGDDDRNVAFSQTVDLALKLRERKVAFEQIVYPDEVHDFLLYKNWIDIYKASASFLDRHLKAPRNAQNSAIDILIRGGNVIDGTGSDARRLDIGVRDDRIVFIGDANTADIAAKRTIDATGLIVAPGFIDPHTHAFEDLNNARDKGNVHYLMQGVTTVLTGNDGGGPVNIADTYARWSRDGIGTNAALFVGHGTVRGKTLGMSDSAPTAEQLESMKAMVAKAMDEGALGMSTGLYYAPGSYAKTEEVIELARVAGARGGVYDTHPRDESSYTIGLLDSTREIIRIGREARIPVHISHIKALGTDVWGKSGEVIALVEAARREGIRVTANQYPYLASGTSLVAALVPRWAEVGGNRELLKRIDDPATRARLVTEMTENMRRRGGAESLLISRANRKEIVGKTLGALAKQWNKPPIEAALDIIKTGGAGVASFNMNEQDIVNFMKQPWVMTGSDGSEGHPRKYGTYPHKLREYVYEKKVITLPRMIQASSAQVAETFGLAERGKIAQGYIADLIVFDEKTIRDRATYEQPEVLAEGIRYVLVNGKPAIEEGKYNGALAGRPVKKRPSQP
ncbi:MAG: prolyl oligopeptidase family serine peptidase [Blastocatellia bacterium]